MNKKQQWSDLPELVTISEVAEYLRVSQPTVRSLIVKEKLKAIQIGGERAVWRIPKSEIEKLLT